jgi:hypothetical protein
VHVSGALAAEGPRPRFVAASRRATRAPKTGRATKRRETTPAAAAGATSGWGNERLGQRAAGATNGRLDSAAVRAFVCQDVAARPTTWDALPPDDVRERPGTIALDNSSVHHRKVVQAAVPLLAQAAVPLLAQAAVPLLAQAGGTCFSLPPYRPELSTSEPVWPHTKYPDRTTRRDADGAALHDAVDTALNPRAAAFKNARHHLSRSA